VGALVDGFDQKEYARALQTVLRMIEEDASLRQRCRSVAANNFSMRTIGQPAYVSVYRELESGGKP